MGEQDKEQSLEKEEKPVEEKPHGKKVSLAKYQELEKELEKALNDANHWKNEYYRVFADTQNLRRTLEEDKARAIKYRAEGFLEELIPAFDNMSMALSSPAKTPELANYLMGFQMIYNQIIQAMDSEGVKVIEPKVGEKFDEKSMQAIDVIEQEGEENLVVRVLHKGYVLKDRMVKPAAVYVSKKPAPQAEESKEPAQA